MSVHSFSPTDAIAITGIGLRFPGADTVAEFWDLLCNGENAVGEVPTERWDIKKLPEGLSKQQQSAMRFGGFINDIKGFDAAFFGISAQEANSLDPKQRLVLETAWHAIEDAGVPQKKLRGSRTGVYVGTSVYDYYQLLCSDERNIDNYLGTGNFNCIVANRLSYFLDLKGPSLSVETACSASLTAVQLACTAIRNGDCDQALVGGAMIMLSPEVTESFARGNFLAPDGRCKAFDNRADGYVRGEGAAMIMLKPLSQAMADNDRIYATILSAVCNQDGRSNGLTAPNPLSQQSLIREACEQAGIKASDIAYVEAHGTGTRLGDPMEVKSLGAVLGRGRAADRPCHIGSVKTNIGHLEAAAGIAGLIKTALSVYHGKLPPSLHFEEPNTLIPFSKLGVKVQEKLEDWPEYAERRLAGVSSFSFGGANAHVILSEAPAASEAMSNSVLLPEIITVSAKTEGVLNSILQSIEDTSRSVDLTKISYSLNCGRSVFRHRLATVVDSFDKLPAKGEWLKGDSQSGKPQVAFLFTGQGGQFPGMITDLYQRFPLFKQHFDRCSKLINRHLGIDLYELCTECTEAVISQTKHTQPVMFAFEYAVASLWISWGVRPVVMVGHSIGEYAAACISGVMTLEFACELVCARAKLMADLPAGGGMLSVFASCETVQELLPASLAFAAFNAAEQVVVSGELEDLKCLALKLEQRGIQSKQLSVSHAFHSPLMEPMLSAFREVATQGQYSDAAIPVISNSEVVTYSDTTVDADYWVRHVTEPVRFDECVECLSEYQVTTLIEIGPGVTLLSLSTQLEELSCVDKLPSLKIDDKGQTILQSLATLFVNGADINFGQYYQGQKRQLISLPNYPFEKQQHWLQYTTGAAKAASIPVRPAHYAKALLGERILSAGSDIVYSCRLNPKALELFYEHRVLKKPILPATAFIDTIYAAVGELGYAFNCAVLQEVEFICPLELPEPINPGETVETVTQLILRKASEGYTAELFSANDFLVDTINWKLHARAVVIVDTPVTTVQADNFLDLKNQCKQHLDLSVFYEQYENRGIDYGPCFQNVSELYIASDDTVTDVIGLITPLGIE